MIWHLNRNGRWSDFQDIVVHGYLKDLVLYRIGGLLPSVSMPVNKLVVDQDGRNALEGTRAVLTPIMELLQIDADLDISWEERAMDKVMGDLADAYGGEGPQDVIVSAARDPRASVRMRRVVGPKLWVVSSTPDGVEVYRDSSGRFRVKRLPEHGGVFSVPWLFEFRLLFDDCLKQKLELCAPKECVQWDPVE